jgi:thiol-disulfide isomerase/thioredoxin
MKILFCLIIVVLPLTLVAQLTISLTGDQQKVAPLLLFTRDFASGENDTVLNFTGEPGNTFDTTVQTSRTFILVLENANILVGANDSISIGYDQENKKYQLLGGRWPENYSIIEQIKKVLLPYNRYDPAADNYIDYVHALDSATLSRSDLLDKIAATKKISGDVFNYMKLYIKYAHVISLMRFRNSRVFNARYPATFSKLVDSFSFSNFDKDKPAIFFEPIYQSALLTFILLQSKREDSLDIAKKAVEFVLNKYKGIERGTMVHLLLVNSPNLAAAIDFEYFGALVSNLPSLDISERYAKGIRDSFHKRRIQGKMINPVILQQAQLQSSDGTVHRFDSILQQYKGQKLLIDFWASWCGPCMAAIPEVKEIEQKYAAKHVKVLYVSMDSNEESWKSAASKLELGSFHYLLKNNFLSPLATHFNIQAIPFYVLLDETGKAQLLELYELPMYL